MKLSNLQIKALKALKIYNFAAPIYGIKTVTLNSLCNRNLVDCENPWSKPADRKYKLTLKGRTVAIGLIREERSK